MRMPNKLDKLLERAKNVRMTPGQVEQQRRSFAYGNSKIENDLITKDTIDREAKALASENDEKNRK